MIAASHSGLVCSSMAVGTCTKASARTMRSAMSETSGPRLYLLSLQSRWKASERFFFIIMARSSGAMSRSSATSDTSRPLSPGSRRQMSGTANCSQTKSSTSVTAK